MREGFKAMPFSIRSMKPEDANVIATWHYPEAYSFYDITADEEDCKEFLDFNHWEKDSKYAVFDAQDSLIGFFEFTLDHDTVDIGLGLRPDITGKGLGMEFVQAGMNFAKDKFSPKQFRLVVATFNQRAIKVYERIGFIESKVFMNHTNGGVHEFMEMLTKI